MAGGQALLLVRGLEVCGFGFMGLWVDRFRGYGLGVRGLGTGTFMGTFL